MASAFCTIATAPWTMPRRPFYRCCVWIRVRSILLVSRNSAYGPHSPRFGTLTRPTKSCSVSASFTQQGKESLNCFDRILRNPPSPLAHADSWFQIGHVYEQQKDVCVFFGSIFVCVFLARTSSTTEQKMPTNVSSLTIQHTPRSSSNWAGCTISTARHSKTKT